MEILNITYIDGESYNKQWIDQRNESGNGGCKHLMSKLKTSL